MQRHQTSTILMITLGLAAGFSCSKKQVATGGGDASGLTSVQVAPPDTSKLSATLKPLLDGYRVVLSSADAATCGSLDAIKSIGSGDVSVDFKLHQGCDYQLTVQMGKLTADTKNLDKVYFSNATGGVGLAIDKGAFLGKTVYEVTVILKATADGIAAGFAPATTMITQSGTTDLSVKTALETAATNDDTLATDRLNKAGGKNTRKAGYACDLFSKESWFIDPLAVYLDSAKTPKMIWTCAPKDGNSVFVADCPAAADTPAGSPCTGAQPVKTTDVWTDATSGKTFPYCVSKDNGKDGWGYENGLSCKMR